VVVKIDTGSLAATAIPLKDQAPLLVDADRMKACQIAVQLFEMIAGRHAQVLISRRVVDHLKLPKQSIFEIRRDISRPDILGEKDT
jgi:hypothetical protein